VEVRDHLYRGNKKALKGTIQFGVSGISKCFHCNCVFGFNIHLLQINSTVRRTVR
jgi:hypothetical protein